jgi:hypothetical protein
MMPSIDPVVERAVKGAFSHVSTNLPAALKRMGISYLSLFLLSLIGIASAALCYPGASLNERSYVTLILLLSLCYTTKAIGYIIKLIRDKRPLRDAPSGPSFAPLRVVMGLVLLVSFSLIPPLAIFAANRMIHWAMGFCIKGAICLFILGIALALAHQLLFAKQITLSPRLIGAIRIPLVFGSIANTSSVAGQRFRLPR